MLGEHVGFARECGQCKAARLDGSDKNRMMVVIVDLEQWTALAEIA